MIKEIDIESFGSFEGFLWNHVRDHANAVVALKPLNIIYGRNYAGKTTLSRIIRSLQEGSLPWKYEGAKFRVRVEGGEIGPADLKAHGLEIRVYNRDFVSENLSFLSDHRDGAIKTFAIVGEQNNRVLEQIESITEQLGSVEEKNGSRYVAAQAAESAKAARRLAADATSVIEDKLRKQANDVIKWDKSFGEPTYNIGSIKQDIEYIRKHGVQALTERDKSVKQDVLKQSALPDVAEPPDFPRMLPAIELRAGALLARRIAPAQPLDDLLLDPLLQTWVKEGIKHHKDVRDSCAFCRQNLPPSLWNILGSHFSAESQDLEAAIDRCLEDLRKEHATALAYRPIQVSAVYASAWDDLTSAQAGLELSYAAYVADLQALEKALVARKASLFESIGAPKLTSDLRGANAATESVRGVVQSNNSKTLSLSIDQKQARVSLRRDNVLSFIKTIDLDAEEEKIAELEAGSMEAAERARLASILNGELESRLSALEVQLKDERKGAERVNEYLGHYFGHAGLRLEAVDIADASGVKFQITRGGVPAYHLSEGECSLISFCYFMATLSAPESKGKELIIYIDDPISSLDSNHLFFMFSLIETLIARPVGRNADGSNRYGYKQLFISTHSLDLLKYLKRLTHGKKGRQSFMIERHGNGPSRISPMPSYLEDYATEFNYLFHQIYNCCDRVQAGGNQERFYSFGNNLRKFFETYSYFKYPFIAGEKSDDLEAINRFLGNDPLSAGVANRLHNELSHLRGQFERGMRPVDIPEIRSLASQVIDRLEAIDPVQFEGLLKSIGVVPHAAAQAG